MVPYADRLLADDEELLADLRPHPLFIAAPLVMVLVAAAVAALIAASFPQAPVAVAWVLAAMVAVPALWCTGRVLRWRSIHLLVTSSRVVYRRGVLGRDVVQLRLSRVADVHCSQNLVDRMLGTGRLVFEVAGDDPVAVDDVRRPRAVQRMVADRLDRLDGFDHTDRTPRTAGAIRPAPSGGAPWAAGAGWSVTAPIAGAAWEELPASFPEGFVASDETPPHGVPHFAGAGRLRGPRADPSAAEAPTCPVQEVTSAHDPSPIPERLIALDDLHRRGILTDEEFAAKKAELLSRF